jgi:transcriptional regulator with XRE-family HTH domain
MTDELRAWLSQELDRRGWSHSELGRRASVSQAAISSTISGDRKADADFCVKVAKTLGEPPDKLLRLGGGLPKASNSEDDTLQEVIELARNLSPEDQKEILEYMRFRYQRRKG